LKKALTIGLVAAALAATLTFVAASSKTGVQSTALSDAPTPAQTAPQTAPHAVMAQNTVLNYDRGPRIIIVPQAGDRDERVNSRASVNSRRYEEDDDDLAPRRDIAPSVRTTPRWAPRAEPPRSERPYVAPPPPRRVEAPTRPRTETRTVRHIDMSKPKAEPKAEAPIPQPPSPRRAVLSAPPPPAEGPTPVRPTPRFDSSLGSKAQSLGAKAQSFGAQAEAPANPVEPAADLTNDSPPPADITADQPPPGYTPPAAMRGQKSADKY
jgi:hypothetical protein